MAKFRGKSAYMGAWSYVLHNVLYAIPLVGFIFLLVHSFSNKNENRMHYARSFFAQALLILILCIAAGVAFYLMVGPEKFAQFVEEVNKNMQQMPTQIPQY